MVRTGAITRHEDTKELRGQSVEWAIYLDVEMTENHARMLLKRKTMS